MKQSAKAADQPKATDVLTNIVDQVIAYRFEEKVPTLADVARVSALGARLLHIRDRAERIACENGATLAFAKKRNLI
jgi:hypothetical protein